MTTALVTGAAGFLGNHLCRYLKAQGYLVIGVDIKQPEFNAPEAHVFRLLDLRDLNNCLQACRDVDHVFALAADMGGLGYIHDGNHAAIYRNNALINLNTIEAARMQGVRRYLFTSSAVVYPQYLQQAPNVTALKEDTVWPADPAEGAYGLEKLATEQLCRYYREEGLLETRIARLHNSMGTHSTYKGGREKAPAAICRKVSLANDGDEIEVWGSGEQTRSFTYVTDTVEGLYRLMQSDYDGPVNIGSSELVTANQLVDTAARIAGKTIRKRYDLTKPEGVKGRNSDNSLCREALGWEPSVPFEVGLRETYLWIDAQIKKTGGR